MPGGRDCEKQSLTVKQPRGACVRSILQPRSLPICVTSTQ